MNTRRARPGGSIARVALFGALALTVLFAAAEIDAITSAEHASSAHHTVAVSRDTKTSVTAATSTRTRGNAWVASLFAALGVVVIAAHRFRAERRPGNRRNLQRFSIRRRGPPLLHVAH